MGVSTSFGLLILRVGIGAFMATHGWGKLQMIREGGLDNFPDPIGLGGGPSLILMVIAELICALLVLVGLATRPAAVVVAFAMGVAAFVVHANDPWTMGEGARLFQEGAAESWSSKEPAFLYMVAFLSLVFTGAGRFSFDWLLWRRGGRATDSAGPSASSGSDV